MNRELLAIQNICTNGRLFCILIFVLAIYTRCPRVAFLATLPIGASVVIEQIYDARIAMIAATGSYAVAAVAALILIINIG